MLTAVVATPGWPLVLVTGVLAASVSTASLLPRTGWFLRSVHTLNALSTLMHEGGHALAACLSGGGVWLIQVHTPDSGVTHTWYRSWISSVLTSAAGYAAPPLLGWWFASLLDRGHAPVVLGVTVAAMALVLLVTRDPITLLCVLLVGLSSFAALKWGTVGVQQWVSYTVTWLLLLCEAAGVAHLVRARWRGTHLADDADSLAARTGVPAPVWVLGWVALIGWVWWKAVPLLW